MNNIKFDLKDIVIVPAEVSEISSRSEVNILQDFEAFKYNNIETYPLMCSPMDTVVNKDNIEIFINNGVVPCMPRGEYIEDYILNVSLRDKYFQSFGLSDVEEQLKEYKKHDPKPLCINYKTFWLYPNVLIDIANGNMVKLINLIKDIKSTFPKITLMVGNIANPDTFWYLAEAGANYIRLGVGTGNACTSSANLGVHYPIGSLIEECHKIKIQQGLWNTKIVADGGMRNFDDIIKSLALGSDYVMIGSLFNKSLESAGFNYFHGIKISNRLATFLYKHNFVITKKYRGMSTKQVQRKWGKQKLTTAEGIVKYQKVEYTLSSWVENFTDYLRSAMSYTNCKKLRDFIGYVNYIFITDAARKRFEK